MSELNVGDEVKVNFTGKVEEIRGYESYLGIRYVVRSDNGAAHMIFELAEGEDFTRTNPEPDFWPPQRGDLWKSGKDVWFARNDVGEIQLYNARISVGGESPVFVLKGHPDLQLVYRDF